MHRLLATHKWVSWVKQAQLILLPILLQLVSYVLLNRLGVLSNGIDIIPFAPKFSIAVCKLHVSILFYNHDHPSNGWFARPYKGIIPASV